MAAGGDARGGTRWRMARNTRVRIADVAREAGVSKAAVSFAFNKPDRLSTETAARIRDVATRMGYRPHPVARMLTAGQTTTIGILSPQALGTGLRQPVLRAVRGGGRVRDGGAAASGCCSSRRSTARCRARSIARPWTASSRVGLDERHPEMELHPPAGLPVVLVDAPAWPGARRRGRRRRGRRAPRRGASAGPGPCDVPGRSASSRPRSGSRCRRASPGAACAATATRCAAAGVELSTARTWCVRPATYRGRRDRVPARLERRPAPHRPCCA